MLEPITAASARFYLMVQRVDLNSPTMTLFLSEEPAREAWRAAALAANRSQPVNGHLITAAKLYTGPSLSNLHDARRLAQAGHLRLIESSSPMPAPAKERVSA